MGKKLSKVEKFIIKANNRYYGKYDYTSVCYVDSKTKVIIKCLEHGEVFEQVPSEHIRGKITCTLCRKPIKGVVKNKTDIFIKKCQLVHNNFYSYEKVHYTKSKNSVLIICPKHGEFGQVASKHLRGSGCIKCSRVKSKESNLMCKSDFIKNSSIKHNNKYDYTNTKLINQHTKVVITCPKHGNFEQVPYDHISGHGCNKCTSSISKTEIEINLFINSLNIKTICSTRKIIKPLELDIYIPSHNIAIEYNGLYWHSEQFVDKNYHLNKTELCEKQGIQLIHIFEDEWLSKQDVVKSMLKNKLGLTENKIYGRKCEIKNVNPSDAIIFINDNHIQGPNNPSIRVGLYYEDELVSIMTFGKPRLGIGSSFDGYELSRFCNKLNTNVLGSASKLLKHFIKTYQPKEIRSYANKSISNGALYRTLGFGLTHVNKPNYHYIIGKERKHRFNFRKELLKKQGFDTKNKTEHEIMLEREIYRIYDCGILSYKLIIK